MIPTIKTNPDLLNSLVKDLLENNMGAFVDANIPETEYAIVDVDRYYKDQRLAQTPPSVDRLAATTCADIKNGYSLFFVEMKQIKDLKKLHEISPESVYKKFTSTANDFCTVRFGQIYNNSSYKIKKIKMYFITDPFNLMGKEVNPIVLKTLLAGTFIEALLLRPPIKFRNKFCIIEYQVPYPIISRS